MNRCDCYGCQQTGRQGICGCLDCDGCGFVSLTPLECVDGETNFYLCPDCLATEERSCA